MAGPAPIKPPQAGTKIRAASRSRQEHKQIAHDGAGRSQGSAAEIRAHRRHVAALSRSNRCRSLHCTCSFVHSGRPLSFRTRARNAFGMFMARAAATQGASACCGFGSTPSLKGRALLLKIIRSARTLFARKIMLTRLASPTISDKQKPQTPRPPPQGIPPPHSRYMLVALQAPALRVQRGVSKRSWGGGAFRLPASRSALPAPQTLRFLLKTSPSGRDIEVKNVRPTGTGVARNTWGVKECWCPHGEGGTLPRSIKT